MLLYRINATDLPGKRKEGKWERNELHTATFPTLKWASDLSVQLLS